MGQGREKAVSVWWEVHSRSVWLKVQYCSDEGGVLVTEAIVFLSGPSRGFDVVETTNRLAPVCFLCLYAISMQIQTY